MRILEWNFDSRPHFIESEFAGPTLAEWAEQQGGLPAIPLERRIAMLVDVARAVSDAHALDILHKDLKPANIFVAMDGSGTPRPKIGDFGSASLLDAARLGELGITNLGFTQTSSIASAATISGTMMYMPPEVLAGISPTPASDVYALGLLLYQLVVGDFRRPLTAGWEADVADELLREDIAAAANGNPTRRLETAGELVDRLTQLDGRRRERTQHAERDARVTSPSSRRWHAPLAVAAIVALVVAGATAFFRRPAPTARADVLPAVAVFPLQNAGANPDADYLRVALADEVATILSHTHGVAVRPLATTSQYRELLGNLSAFGREVGVDTVVTGHFLEANDRLTITLEAIDVGTGRLVWRDTLDAPAATMTATQVQLALRVRGGLAPALGATSDDAAAEPKNADASDAFLRSVAFSWDAGPNREGIDMLRRSLALDDSYAPAWHALSKRYCVEARYGNGDISLLDEAMAAARRAVALDPGYVGAAAELIIHIVEQGDLVTAHARAAELVRRRPDSVDALFSMSYVLRYAGLLDDAGTYCERAFLLDPRNRTSGLRSCAVVFLLRGDATRAANYLHLDEGSDFERALTVRMRIARGEIDEARRVGSVGLPQWGGYRLLLACAANDASRSNRRLRIRRSSLG
ncbi:MAG: protein kinase [Vicinamibacterales bacterium]